MLNKINLIYLVLCVCAAAVEHTLLKSPSVAYTYVWTAICISYPFSIVIAQSSVKFWKGFLSLLVILAISQGLELAVILTREGGFQGLLHPDWETVIFFGFYSIEPLGNWIIWYPIGYLLVWLLFRRGWLSDRGR